MARVGIAARLADSGQRAKPPELGVVHLMRAQTTMVVKERKKGLGTVLFAIDARLEVQEAAKATVWLGGSLARAALRPAQVQEQVFSSVLQLPAPGFLELARRLSHRLPRAAVEPRPARLNSSIAAASDKNS